MIGKMIFAAAIACTALGGAHARSAFDPRNVYGYVDPDAKFKEEQREMERQLEAEHLHAHVLGFDGKRDHKRFHENLDRARNDWHARYYRSHRGR